MDCENTDEIFERHLEILGVLETKQIENQVEINYIKRM